MMTGAEENRVYQQAARYCSYQERTTQETKAKLQTLGATPEEVEQLIQQLKEERFLDEERYVEAFIRGKFLGKHWGKRKLLVALTKKGLDPALIQQGLDAIEEADYLQTLRRVAHRKKQLLAGEDYTQIKRKLTNYLLQKGYEPDLVYQTVQELIAQSS